MPKIRTLKAMTHTDAGVLSMLIALPASNAPNSIASQFSEPAWAAVE